MSLNQTSLFDRARRTLYVEHRPLPNRIGPVDLGDRNKTYAVTLPYSKIIAPDGTVYYETNHALSKINSGGDLDSLVFIKPVWGEVEDVEQAKLTVSDGLEGVPTGQTRNNPELLDLHKFGWS